MSAYANSAVVLDPALLPNKLWKLWEKLAEAENILRDTTGLDFSLDDIPTYLKEYKKEKHAENVKAVVDFLDAEIAFKEAWHKTYPDLHIEISYYDEKEHGKDEIDGMYAVVDAEMPKPQAKALFKKGILERKYWVTYG